MTIINTRYRYSWSATTPVVAAESHQHTTNMSSKLQSINATPRYTKPCYIERRDRPSGLSILGPVAVTEVAAVIIDADGGAGGAVVTGSGHYGAGGEGGRQPE